MCVRIVVTDTDSSRAISGADKLVGRYRSTRISLWLSGSTSRGKSASREGDPLAAALPREAGSGFLPLALPVRRDPEHSDRNGWVSECVPGDRLLRTSPLARPCSPISARSCSARPSSPSRIRACSRNARIRISGQSGASSCVDSRSASSCRRRQISPAPNASTLGALATGSARQRKASAGWWAMTAATWNSRCGPATGSARPC
jgi:hypothetical protein